MKLKMMTIGLLGFAISGVPGFADPAQAHRQPARPGTVNYLEGTAWLDGQPLDSKDVGNATLAAGQELRTENGKAEILLTPGVFLRLDDNSAVKMVSPQLTLTQVELEKGRAGVEVNEIHDQNNLQVIDAGVTTRLEKKGYYQFDADQPTAMVFKGEAKTEVADGKWRKIKGNHQLALTGESLAEAKPEDFDASSGDELYKWSSLRSQYLAEANNQIAAEYAPSGYAPGWYWNPYGLGYTFIGAGPFYSPFGWGYYPFGWGPYAGLRYGWYGGYWGHGPYVGRVPYVGHGPYHRLGDSHAPHVVTGGGFRGATGIRGGAAGGFHGAPGGGFHGPVGGGVRGGMGPRR